MFIKKHNTKKIKKRQLIELVSIKSKDMNSKDLFKTFKLNRNEPIGHKEKPKKIQFIDESIIFDLPLNTNKPFKSNINTRIIPEKSEDKDEIVSKISIKSEENFSINEVLKPKNSNLRVSSIFETRPKLSKKVTACKTLSEDEKDDEKSGKTLFRNFFNFKPKKNQKERGKEIIKGEGENKNQFARRTSIDLDIEEAIRDQVSKGRNLLEKVFKGVK